ncbi:MAG TPA: beta-propeller fold lactonase family protein, partial [Planctomycetota bacterium]|nr:beta-propeller fold lactonase family protein [Planctomycetota bacterium]
MANRFLTLTELSILVALAGCSTDEWLGSGPGAEASVTTPSGVQSGLIEVVYTLSGKDVTQSDVSFSFSRGGGSFRTASEGPGSDGTSNLSVSEGGDTHRFVWDSGMDLGGVREPAVVIRVRPEGGTSDSTGAIAVHNGRFLAAVENRQAGRVRLHELDIVEGGVSFLRTVATGGNDPYDILFQGGFFLIAHRTSNSVAVLTLDEVAETLVPAEGSPFAGDGVGSKYLASDGTRVFVSNTGSSTITVFNFDSATGKLTLGPHSGVFAPGCRSLVTRSSRLYVASETVGQIEIFDIDSDGELFVNGASPVTVGGLASPRAMAIAGSRLYAANAGEATLCGFNFQGGGDLTAIAGSPFGITELGVEQLARNGSKLFAVTGTGERFLSLGIDPLGVVMADAGFPAVLTGPSFTVASAGSVAVLAATTSRRFE